MNVRLGFAHRGLSDWPAPRGRFLPASAPLAPALPDSHPRAVLAAAVALPAQPDWHGGHDPAAHALDLPLAAARPVWEASRLGALPLLAQAARCDPAGGHLARAEALLGAWCAANPPFRGVAWACGQEAALRALHLALALALLDADRDPPPAARALLALCGRRIVATSLYALAQDNNHPVSEAAGAFAIALLLREDTSRPASALAARVARLVAPDGGFAQVSAGYARLLLDVLAIAEWLRRRHAAPAFPAPLAERAAALAGWLHRITAPTTGGTPRLGLEDGSAFADLSLAGPADARGSVERAARLFAGRGADSPEDPGCAWLSLPRPEGTLHRPARWRAAGTMGWAEGPAMALLRTGPLRFRPGQADLLHLSLRDGDNWVLRDGGTGRYDPPEPWWWAALAGAAAHNAPVFDQAEPMPRVGRFLLANWPAMRPIPDGATLRDARGNRVTRSVRPEGRRFVVEDKLSGPFRAVAWHWRLCPGAWRVTPDGLVGEAATISVIADAPLRLDLTDGWESPSYGAIVPAPLLRVTASAPIGRVTTTIRLP
ncbi:heparinase II/III family protein [Falsiroseomonas sp.]|uniref:heparinase II/III domain-containing protein n=1 Tax=Falsiroseomonas sp. TaxID=2870721 RepID=UPI0034A28FDC